MFGFRKLTSCCCVIALILFLISWNLILNGIHILPMQNLKHFNVINSYNDHDNINLKQVQQQILMHNISMMIHNRYQHFKIVLLNIVIDDRNTSYTTNPKLKLFGIMPYQLLPATFWAKSHYKIKYCNLWNKCMVNYHLNMPQLILKNINKHSSILLFKDIDCTVQNLEQNEFHLMQRRRGNDYAMVIIQCDLASNINQQNYEIEYFEITISYNVNVSFTSFLFPKTFNQSIVSNFTDNFYATQTVHYNYDTSMDENIEIRWLDDKYKFENNIVQNIGVCATTTFGFPPFVSLWMYHHVGLALIDTILMYVNYASISIEYEAFLDSVRTRVEFDKIQIINWTIVNEIPKTSSFYEFQQLAYLHCQYTNMYKYKWLLYLDADDALIIFNNIAFSNFIESIQYNTAIHSIQYPWIGWSYSCIYHLLDKSISKNENMTFCQLQHGGISFYPPHWGKYMMKPTFVEIPFIHNVQKAMNKSTSIYVSGKINDFVYIQHMQSHKLRSSFKTYDQHIQCTESLKNQTFLFSQNMKYLNQGTLKNNHTQQWMNIMFNTNIVNANHSYYC